MKKHLLPAPFLLAACLLAAFLPRLVMALNTPVIAIDGVGYIEASRGGTDAAADARLPMYPFLIKVVGGMVGGPITGGQAISVFFGTLFALMMGLLARRLLPQGGAWAVFLLAAFQPYLIRFSGDVLTEPLFLCLMVALFLCLEYARLRPYLAVAGGLVGAGLCLTRPEGIAVVVVASLAFVRDQRRDALSNQNTPGSHAIPGSQVNSGFQGPRLGAFLFFAVLLACLMPAYLAGEFNQKAEGTLAKTYFENLATMEGTPPPEDPPSLVEFIRAEPGRFIKKTVRGLGEGVLRLSEALHPAVFLLALIGIWAVWKKRIRPAPMRPALWTSFFLFLFFCTVYPSKRYMLQCCIPFLLWAGWAVCWIESREKHGPRIAVIVMIVTMILCQAKAGFGQRDDKRYLRDKAVSISIMCKGRLPVLITKSCRLAFYAGGKRIDPDDIMDENSAIDFRKLENRIVDLPLNRIFFVYENETNLTDLSHDSIDVILIKLR